MKRTLREFTETNGKRLLIDTNDISFAEEVSNSACRIITKQGANIEVTSSYNDLVRNITD